jgi:uncharacterized membrane protein
MNAAQLVPYLLFLHVMGAIIAFGPTFAYSIMGAAAAREPEHANFSSRQVASIGNALVYPLAIVQGITGVLLIWAAGINVMSSAWLGLGIILYLITLVYALTVQRNTLHHLIELSSTPPPPGTPPGPPPPEVVRTVKKIQRGGMFLGLMVVIIVFLMVVKPTF